LTAAASLYLIIQLRDGEEAHPDLLVRRAVYVMKERVASRPLDLLTLFPLFAGNSVLGHVHQLAWLYQKSKLQGKILFLVKIF
jgi:hypothetical protein